MHLKNLLFAVLFIALSHDTSNAGSSSKIAFVSLRDHNFDIFLVNPDGSEQVKLTQSPGYDVNPVWSPDGMRLAFVSNREYIVFKDGFLVPVRTSTTTIST